MNKVDDFLQLSSISRQNRYYHVYYSAVISVDTWRYVQKYTLPNLHTASDKAKRRLLEKIDHIISNLPQVENITVPLNEIDRNCSKAVLDKHLAWVRWSAAGFSAYEQILCDHPVRAKTTAYCIIAGGKQRNARQEDTESIEHDVFRPLRSLNLTKMVADMEFLRTHWSTVQLLVDLAAHMRLTLKPNFAFLKYAPDAQVYSPPNFQGKFLKAQSFAVLTSDGYLNARGKPGPLSLAKIYDNSETAQRSARASKVSSFDIAQLSVSFQCIESPNTELGQNIVSVSEQNQLSRIVVKTARAAQTKNTPSQTSEEAHTPQTSRL